MLDFGYGLLAMIVSIVMIPLCIMEWKYRHHPGMKWLLFAGISMTMWSLCSAGYFFSTSPALATMFWNFKYIGIALGPPAFLMMILCFFRPSTEIPRAIRAALFVLPLLTSVIAVTNPLHGLFYQNFVIVFGQPHRDLVYAYGMWFYIHSIFSYMTVLASLVVVVVYIRNMPRSYRTSGYIMLAALLVSLVFSMLNVLNLLGTPFDISMPGMIITQYLMFSILQDSEHVHWLLLAKDTVFQLMSCGAFITDRDGLICESNQMARNLLGDLLANRIGRQQLVQRLVTRYNGKMLENNILELQLDQGTQYYEIRESPIHDNQSDYLGAFVELRDVTLQQQLITRLSYLVNVDQMTSIYNRPYYEKMCLEMDRPDSLPLGVIQCDLNRLKHINDRLGHEMGDAYIITAVDALRSQAPDKVIIARTGGDEFSLLFPNTSIEEIQDYIKRVLDIAYVDADSPFYLPELSKEGESVISMGFSIKMAPEQDLLRIRDEADKSMYKAKYDSRHNDMI